MPITPATVPQGAELVYSPLIAPNVRAYIIGLGLFVFGLFGIYRLFVHSAGGQAGERAATPSTD